MFFVLRPSPTPHKFSNGPSLNLFEPQVTLTVPLSPLSIINKVDIQGRCTEWNIFCKNSLRARYIRNALVGMADFPWPIFALHSHFCCIFLVIVAGICSWCALVSVVDYDPGLSSADDVATSKEKGSIRSVTGTDLFIFLKCTCIHTVYIFAPRRIIWVLKNLTETMISHIEACVLLKCAEHGSLYECIFDW